MPWTKHRTDRQIDAQSRNALGEVEGLAYEKGIRWLRGEEMTTPQLYMLLYSERQEKANVYLKSVCAWMQCELMQKGVEPDVGLKRISGQLLQCGACPIPLYTVLRSLLSMREKSKTMMVNHDKHERCLGSGLIRGNSNRRNIFCLPI